ncbi:MAG TPA: energy-coupling factor transporter transmembrane component T [Longilinea sp.]|nr:energy-coupling factor transporter transmembrane component T [Longilinea sp.]
MSQFEFLRSVTIGQYLPLDSPLHRLDARVKLLGFVVLLLAITLTPRLAGLLLGIGFVLIGLLLSHAPLRFALRGLLSPLPFLLILAVLQVLVNFYPDTSPVLLHWGIITISVNDLLLGAALLVRFMGLILLISLVSFCLSESELTHGLEALLRPLEKLGFQPYDLVMTVQVTLRFLPLLAQTAERIAKAQYSRGADWGTGKGGLIRRARQIVPLILPLFLSSLRRAEKMALAMDARAYGVSRCRTSLGDLRFKLKDGGALLLALALSILILVV